MEELLILGNIHFKKKYTRSKTFCIICCSYIHWNKDKGKTPLKLIRTFYATVLSILNLYEKIKQYTSSTMSYWLFLCLSEKKNYNYNEPKEGKKL